MNNRGPMTSNGIYQMISRRGQQAGVGLADELPKRDDDGLAPELL